MLASWISNTLNIVMASSPWNNSLMIGHVKGMDGWHGRLTWKAKGTMSAWRRRRSSWSLVMATMSSKKYVKYSCAVCCNGVGCSSILCPQCILWIHKKYSRITKRLTPDENYVFPRCKGESRFIYGRTVTDVDVDGTILDVVITFCYLRDKVCSVGAATVPLRSYVV